MNQCPKCSHQQQAGQFCQACGYQLDSSETTNQPQNTPPIESAQKNTTENTPENAPENTSGNLHTQAPKTFPTPKDIDESIFQPIVDVDLEQLITMPSADTDQAQPESPPTLPPVPQPTIVPDEPPADVQTAEHESVFDVPVASGSKRLKSKSLVTSIIVAMVAVLLLGGVTIIVLQIKETINRDPDQSQTDPSDPTATTSQTPPDLTQKQIDALVNKANELDRQYKHLKIEMTSPALTQLVGQGKTINEQVQARLSEKNYKEASTLITQFDSILSQIQTTQQALVDQQKANQVQQAMALLREQAQQARNTTDQLKAKVVSAGALPATDPVLKKAGQMYDAAVLRFEKQQYELATNGFAQAAKLYEQMTKSTLDKTRLIADRDALTMRIASDLNESLCRKHASATYQELIDQLTLVNTKIKASELESATEILSTAWRLFPKVQQEIDQYQNVKFYAWQAGYMTTDVLLNVAADQPLTDAQLKQLTQAYADLLIDVDLLKDLPVDRSASYEKVAMYLVINAQRELTKQRGDIAGHVFNVGFHSRLITRLLKPRVNQTAISSQNITDIKRSANLIKRLASQAQFDPAMQTLMDQFIEHLPKADADLPALLQSQQQFDHLIKQLSHVDTATKLLGK